MNKLMQLMSKKVTLAEVLLVLFAFMWMSIEQFNNENISIKLIVFAIIIGVVTHGIIYWSMKKEILQKKGWK